MRLCPFSSSAWENEEKLRGMYGRTLPSLPFVTPLNSSETKVNPILSVPKKRRSVSKIAPPKPACPDGYAGNGGVKFGPTRLLAGAPRGRKVGSQVVAELPSPAPSGPVPASDSRMPVIGRQKSQ